MNPRLVSTVLLLSTAALSLPTTASAQSITETQPIGTTIAKGTSQTYGLAVISAPSNAVITNVQAQFDYTAFNGLEDYLSVRFNRNTQPGATDGVQLVGLGSLPDSGANGSTYGWVSFSNWNDLPANSPYYFRFTHDGSSPFPFDPTIHGIAVRVTYSVPPPLPPPNLVSPLNGATTSSNILEWQTVSGATGYQIEVSGSPVDINNGSQTTYAFTLPFGPATWRARTKNSSGVYGDWSALQSFTYEAAALPPPNLVSPLNGATTSSNILQWQTVSGATGYQLEVSGNPVDINSGSQTTYAFTLPFGPATWRARTKNSSGVYGSWSALQSFTYEAAVLPPPNPVSPLTGTTTSSNVVQWETVSGATGYQLEISGNPVDINDGNQTTYAFTLPFGPATWRARTKNGSGVHGSWSALQSFTYEVSIDVEPLNVSLSATSFSPGDPLTVSWQIRNNGTSTAATSDSQLRISASGTSYGNSTNNVGSPQPTGSIAPGATVDQNESASVPVTPGTYYAWVIADNFSELAQTDTTNDFAVSMPFVVDPNVPGPFTLTADPPVWDTEPPPGPAVQLRWTTAGTGATYEIYRDSAKIFPTVGTFPGLAFRNEVGLSAGQTYDYHVVATNAAGSTQSNTVSVGPMPDAGAAPNAYSASPGTLVQGNGYQTVLIVGDGFDGSVWHQFSTDGGASWLPAQSAPIVNGQTSISVGVNDTVVQTVLLRVCASFGSSACSGSVSVAIQPATGEVAPQLTGAVPDTLPLGVGTQSVALSGTAFVSSNRYQQSFDGGSTWVWAVGPPTVFSPTSMSVDVADTALGTVRVRVCASQGSANCSGSLVIAVQPAAIPTPAITSVSPASFEEGASSRRVTITGSDFSATSWHEFSHDGGANWILATAAPAIDDVDRMRVSVSDTVAGTVRVRVCAAYGSSSCSGSLPIVVTPAQEVPQLGSACPTSGCTSTASKAIVITHGWNSNAFDWPLEMANAICAELNASQYYSNFPPDSIVQRCSAGVWDVWLVDWSTAAFTGSFIPYVFLVQAKIRGPELAAFFIANYQYEHFHLIAHSAGSQLIDEATDTMKAAGVTATIHATFLDAAYFPVIPSLIDSTRHQANYGKNADWVDNYVDTRPLDVGVLEVVGWEFLRQLDTTDLHLASGFNVDVTPHAAGCGLNPVCYHSRPIEFYIKSIDPDHDEDPGDPIASTGGMGFPLSMEAGSSMNALAVSKDLECRMENDGTCTPVAWTPGTLLNFPAALVETLVDGAQGTVDFVKSVPEKIGGVWDRIKLETSQLLPASSTSGFAARSSSTSDDPAYFTTTVETMAPVNLLRFNWAFDVQGQGLLHVYVDGELVSQIDQRLATPISVELEEVDIGGTAGVLAPGAHEVAFRLDGFGAAPSGLELTNVELVLAQMTDPSSFSVVPSVGLDGGVDPNLPQSVSPGGLTSFTVTSDEGFTIDRDVGGTCPVGSWVADTWTTGAIVGDCSVDFGFLVDTDGDGVSDGSDADTTNPFVCRDGDADTCDDCSTGSDDPANDGVDTDADGYCDAGDTDDDGDGLVDVVETGSGIYVSPADTGSDPLNPDTDGDGFGDGDEVSGGTDPNDPFSFPGGGPTPNSHSIDLETSAQQYLQAADSGSLSSITQDFTFELWLKLESFGPWSLASKWHWPSDQRSWQVELGYGGGVSNGIGLAVNQDGSETGSGSAFIPWMPALGTWYHVAVVYDADGGASNGLVELFVDGVSQGSSEGTLRQSIFAGSANLHLGSASGIQQHFDGLMDDVRVWNVKRTEGQIRGNRFRQLSGDEANLVGYWRFNGDLLDATPNGNDLTDVNGTTFSSDVPFGEDQDSDGILDDGDGSGIAGDMPCVGGATQGCDDNCIAIANPVQEDTDADAVGDVCDADDDGDGLLDTVETNTGVYVSGTDTGTDPLEADSDGDGIDDGAEVTAGSDPNDANSMPGQGNSHSVELVRASGQYLWIADASQTGLDLLTEFTLEAWVKMASLPGVDEEFYLVSKSNGSSFGYGLILAEQTGQLNLALELSDTNPAANERPNVDWDPVVGRWYHVAASFDGGAREVRFYVDGIQQGPVLTTTLSSIQNTGRDFAVGGRDGGAKTFDGKIDDARAWSLVRPAAEISADRYSELTEMEPGLAGYWKLNGDLADETSNGNGLSNENAAGFSTDVPFGPRSIALELDLGEFASISDVDQLGLDITGDLTIEAWVKPESSGPDRAIVSKHDGDANQRSFYLGVYNDAVQFLVSDNGGGSSSQTASVANTLLSVGTWQHVAVTYDSATGTAIHYLNGAPDGVVTSHKTSIFSGGAPVAVGASFDLGQPIHFFDGLIDEVRIWNLVRTEAEIAGDRDHELTGTENGLVAYWRFNGDLLDEGLNENDLTGGGAPSYSPDIPLPEPSVPLLLFPGVALLIYLYRRRRARWV